MILGLGALFQDPNRSVGILRGLIQNVKKVLFAHGKRTRAGDQHASRAEHFESPQVQLFIPAQG